MSAQLRARLGKLILLLGSPQDGERSAAVEAIGRTLEASGHDWHFLAALIEGADSLPAEAPGHGFSPASGDDARLFETMLRLDSDGRLTPAQSRFVFGCAAQWERARWLSAKQRTILVEILDDARARSRRRRRAS